MWTSLKAQLFFYSSDYSLPTSSFSFFNFFFLYYRCLLEEIFFHALIGSQYQSRDRADVLVFVALDCRTRFSFIIQNRTFPQPKTHFFFLS